MYNLTNGVKIIGLLVAFCFGGCSSSYYVKLVDQDGDPIPGAEIVYATQSGNSYFNDRDPHREKSDANGIAKLTYANQNEFFRIEKSGYQFDFRRQLLQRFGNLYGGQLKKYTRSKPLVIYGWRRGEEPNLVYAKGRIAGVTDEDDCLINLVMANQYPSFVENIRLKVSVDELFGTNLEVVNGEIKKTDDVFLHRADEEGYSSSVTIPFSLDGEPKFFYIKGKGGYYYGGAIVYTLLVKSNNQAQKEPAKLRARAEFWFNLNGSRNIMRPENADWAVDTRAGRDVLSCEK